MTEMAALYRLMSWLSPSYPVGAYTYSHGLEQAVEAGYVTDRKTAQDWIADAVLFGTGFSDTVFLAEAHRAAKLRDVHRLGEVKELAAAFVATKELALESRAQGEAFIEITRKAWACDALEQIEAIDDCAMTYPVAVGCAAAGHEIAIEPAVHAYLHGFSANLVSAAVRLVPLGQTDGQRITAALEQVTIETAGKALATDIDDVSSATLMLDICSMKHENQHTRLFRS